jgi:hypothetical protein
LSLETKDWTANKNRSLETEHPFFVLLHGVAKIIANNQKFFPKEADCDFLNPPHDEIDYA